METLGPFKGIYRVIKGVIYNCNNSAIPSFGAVPNKRHIIPVTLTQELHPHPSYSLVLNT